MKPIQEITLRKYEKPIKLEGRDLTKKFLLSLGLLQINDKRDVIVDIFEALLEDDLTTEQISQKIKGKQGSAQSNIRRQIRRLKDAKIVEKENNKYKISDRLSEIFEEYENIYLPSITSRIKEYFQKIEKRWEDGRQEMSKMQK